ncbi:MAG TPA: amidohydrolase family protein, partial [Nakamurella sp.]
MTLTVLRNGRVHTAADPEATALAVTDGTISWVGGEHAVDTAGPPDRVIDLAGALVVPGFVDAHVHTLDAGLALTGLDLSGTRSLAECLAAVRTYAADHDGIVWGHGWEDTRWPEQRPPTRSEIDEAVGHRPAYLSRIDVHSAQLSTALARLIADRADGWSDVAPVTRQAHAGVRASARGLLTAEQRRDARLAFLRSCAAQGIVEVHECAADGPTGLADLAALLDLDGPIPVRGYLARAVTDPDQARVALAETGAHALGGDLVVDGAIGSRTAALTDPYRDCPDDRGVRYLTDEQIVEHLVACTIAGVQAGFHAIGDDAVSAVARALSDAAQRLGENATVRMAACAHRVEHAEMTDAEAIATFART